MRHALSSLTKHLDALLSATATLLPLTSLLVQEVLRAAVGVELRTGTAILNLLGTGAAGLLGMVVLVILLCRDFKAKALPPFIALGCFAFALSTLIAAGILALHGASALCGGSLGECGRWN